MNEGDKGKLRYLLMELCIRQDDVTHWNEKGPDYAKEAQVAIVHRNEAETKIIDFVESLVKQ